MIYFLSPVFLVLKHLSMKQIPIDVCYELIKLNFFGKYKKNYNYVRNIYFFSDYLRNICINKLLMSNLQNSLLKT